MYVQKVTGMHLVEGLLDCIVHAHNLTPGTINVLCSLLTDTLCFLRGCRSHSCADRT